MGRINLQNSGQGFIGAQEGMQHTWTKNFEKGGPPSLANAHVSRDTDASVANSAQKPMIIMPASITVGALVDLVACH